MNHLGDANKMVSDTPRTDKIMFTVDVCDGEDVVNVEFARQLERELNVAYLQMELLTKSNFQLREGRLELKQRINQLETENDAMRADLLLWRDTTDAMCSKAGIGFTTEDKP